MTAREVIARLRSEGWEERPGKGSHTIFMKPGVGTVIVPNHREDIPTETLRAIFRAAGWLWPP
jgi:predicted RNA binding protein YcfA (HicA-like mRNA interferase family)